MKRKAEHDVRNVQTTPVSLTALGSSDDTFWPVTYSCKANGRWVTAKCKARLTLSRSSATGHAEHLVVVLEAEGGDSSNRLVESLGLGQTQPKAVAYAAKTCLHMKIAAREFMVRFKSEDRCNECCSLLRGRIDFQSPAFASSQVLCATATQSETQLGDTDKDLEEMTQCTSSAGEKGTREDRHDKERLQGISQAAAPGINSNISTIALQKPTSEDADLAITEENLDYYLSMCLQDKRFPALVRQIEKIMTQNPRLFAAINRSE